ncbi:MAG: hypothetical protein QM726_10605 [Chitinophagaceae bacterium]
MAKYASLSNNGYDVRIPEKTGDNIHVWVASDMPSYFNPRNITLTLNVFSRDLQLLTQKRFHLQQITNYSIDFFYTDTCYYASIVSVVAEGPYRTVFKISYNGNFNNATDSPLVFVQPPFKQMTNNYAIAQGNQNLFAIVTKNSVIADSAELNKVSFLGRENLITENGFQIVRIAKTDMKGHQELEKIYGSSNFNFLNPFIIFHDTTIIGCAFANALPKKGRSNPYYGSYLFLKKLDTSLIDHAEEPALIQIENPARGDDYYQPLGIYPINNGLVVASVGKSNYENTRSYAPMYGNRNRISIFMPLVPNFNMANSLRITVVGQNNELLRDTIIGSGQKSAQMEWGTRFISASANKIDFFCSIRYRGSRYGIVRTSIDSDGTIQENNIILDDHYNYRLGAAIKLNTGELIVPYEKNGRIKGIIKLAYERND